MTIAARNSVTGTVPAARICPTSCRLARCSDSSGVLVAEPAQVDDLPEIAVVRSRNEVEGRGPISRGEASSASHRMHQVVRGVASFDGVRRWSDSSSRSTRTDVDLFGPRHRGELRQGSREVATQRGGLLPTAARPADLRRIRSLRTRRSRRGEESPASGAVVAVRPAHVCHVQSRSISEIRRTYSSGSALRSQPRGCHRSGLAEHVPLLPCPVPQAEHPGDVAIGVGVASVVEMSVVQGQHRPVCVFGSVAPLEDLLAPIHPHVVVEITGFADLDHGGVPVRIVGLGALELSAGVDVSHVGRPRCSSRVVRRPFGQRRVLVVVGLELHVVEPELASHDRAPRCTSRSCRQVRPTP